MKRKYPHLSKPIQIGKVNFRNRMFSAPMGGTDITADFCIGPASKAFYELRAKGGAGAVTVSEVMVHGETDGSHAYHLDLSIPGSLASATYTADGIRRHGSIPSVELSHSGQFAGTYLADKNKKQSLAQWGVSPAVRADGVKVQPLTQEKIDEIVAAYGEAAGLAKRAGFEMVMVHGGHGWLINQFLSPLFNKRDDQYSGSLENRCRFAIEVLTSVRNAVGEGFPIEFRMSGSEFVEGGYELDEGVKIAKMVEDYVDLIHVSAGTYQGTFGITHPSMFTEHGTNVYLAAEIKKHVSKPVATIGGLNDPEHMEEIIASGKADIVEMARALLADPFLPRKVMENKEEDIVHCLRCFVCMAERAQTTTRRCTVNPLIGRELEGSEIGLAPQKKKVVVVGGGPGGLEAAKTAAQRGHEVILFEKENELGGILNCEEAIPFKYEMYQLGQTFAKQAENLGVTIRLNTPATKKIVEAEAPDALIVAAGSSPIIPAIEGISGENVVLINDYHKQTNKIKDTVVVLGGGLAGCEAAVHFARQGKKATVVEMRAEVAPDANVRYRPLLLQELAKDVTIKTGYQGMKITSEGLVCKDPEGNEVLIPAESVVVAVGQRPNRSVAEELIDAAPYVVEIGDVVRASTITTAVYQGYHAAMDI
ncbi:FAD-dependent oxidoreductase [Candidatus Enterococcus clewellii]|uniref:NADH:flavin oxidoreductase n=1 Tax=Candidatus Enterococcus clewellii TaxID=1834193 RepID=A0A242KDD2_9ENTE|nr:FAD-dependent oxidoreductase [Enterococcus sp. 9E7_DIV0242]OTP19079.1 NADH:flavin oxidoreductase [Enterococcus sp. 9E7_DIV0242]